MRKRTKNKLRSCALCKPHKTGHSCRWKERDLHKLRVWEKERQEILSVD